MTAVYAARPKRPKTCPGTEKTVEGTKKASPERCFFVCLGRESNPHGLFGPRDFLAAMAFATGGIAATRS